MDLVRLKLLFVIKSLSASVGGAERVLCDVAAGLASRGHEVTIATFDAKDSAPFYELPPSVSLLNLSIGHVSKRARFWETALRMRALRKLVRTSSFDVVIGFMHSVFVLLGVALLGTGTTVIASEHISYDHYRTRPLQAMLLALSPLLVQRFTIITEEVRRGFPKQLRERMSVLPNPVALNLAGAAQRKEQTTRKTILSVGRLAAQKDQKTLVSAFANIAAEHPDWDLRIIGEGELRAELERQIDALGLSHRVLLPGTTSNIAAEYLGAQLYATPSLYESFGLATAEALATGLPAVGFADCPGTNEIIIPGVNGVLVEGVDRPAALADGLARLMDAEDERMELAAAAAASVARFTLPPVLDQWEKLLNETDGGSQ